MISLWQDITYELRLLSKNAGFSIIAILTLALGIGANTTLFSVVNGVLLNPLPFPDSDKLLSIYTKTDNFDRSSISYPNFLDWQKDNHSFTGLAAYRSNEMNMTGSGEPERLHGHMISAEFFPTLEVVPIAGRNFRPEEDLPAAGPVVILGDELWKRRFGSSADIVGKNISLDGRSYTIVGIASQRLPMVSPSDVYIPIGQWNDPTFRDRHVGMGTRSLGRLKPGVSIQQAQADLNNIAKNLADAYPDSNKGSGIEILSLKSDVVGDVRTILLVLLGAVTFVLLIACANVANLLLARSTGRTREFAIRSALGASPWRVVRQLLTESLILGTVGGFLGSLLAKVGTKAVLAALPDALPRADEIHMDWHVFLFTAVASILTSIIFGLAPAMKLLAPRLDETLKEGSRGSSGKRSFLQRALVATEMAMALVLLVGAGLMIRSLTELWQINPGFNPRNVLSFAVSLTSDSKVTPDQMRSKFRESIKQFGSVQGVEKTSMIVGSLPMSGDSELPFWLEGQPKPANQNDMPFALFYCVTPNYRVAMEIPLLRGRFLTDQDDEHSPSVVVIDANLAKKFFPNQDPIGKHLNIALFDVQPEIVGIVGHIEHWGLGDNGHQTLQTQIYLPVWQIPNQFWTLLAGGSSYVARTTSSEGLAGRLREAAQRFDNSAVLYEVKPMDDIVAGSISNQKLTMMLLCLFSGLALVLSAIGVYGVIAYLASQRTHEIGIRLALGASRRDVLRMVLGDGMRITLIGIAIGVAFAFALTRLLSKVIYGVSATDPLTFIGVAILLTGVALLACYLPARRAMQVDPMVVLRYE